MRKPITIVGGGLAGLTLGIGLRQRGIPVTVCEAGRYPRHRVCGEFISGSGQAVLARMGLRTRFIEAGAFEARTVQFITGTNHSPVRELPVTALCLSRFAMDALLADEFCQLDGELRESVRWTAKEAEGVVHASGRRAHPTDNGWRWFGLKAHTRDVKLAADLEMHVSRSGYVGVNRINGDEVNVCGLFRARPGSSPMETGFGLLRGTPGSALHERLATARFDEASLCSVAGLSLKRQPADSTECRVGDALTMIPPVTGNGMSMALESAEIAVEPLTAYSQNRMSWTEAQQKIASECDTAFARRLGWAGVLQRLMFSPVLQTSLSSFLLRSDWLWRLMFARTR